MPLFVSLNSVGLIRLLEVNISWITLSEATQNLLTPVLGSLVQSNLKKIDLYQLMGTLKDFGVR